MKRAVLSLMGGALLWTAAIATGCGAPGRPVPAAKGARADAGAEAGAGARGAAGADADASVKVATLDALAARAATDAPLMREILRVPHASPKSPDIKIDHDLCVRAAVAASRPARAWFEDAGGARRGDATVTSDGMVPPAGPACARKGETLRLVVDPPDPRARAVIFGAP